MPKVTDSVALGHNLRRLRRSQEIQLQQVTDRLDLSRSSIQRFEKGQHDMRTSQLLELVSLLGYEVLIVKKDDSE